jgi:hypothetical protein
MIMTEFGAAKDTKYSSTHTISYHTIPYLHVFAAMFECVFPILCRGDLRAVEETVKMADEWQQSWMYWQFKYFQVALHTDACMHG